MSRAAGIEAVSTYEDLVREADMVLSILKPAEAEKAATKVALSARTTFVAATASRSARSRPLNPFRSKAQLAIRLLS